MQKYRTSDSEGMWKTNLIDEQWSVSCDNTISTSLWCDVTKCNVWYTVYTVYLITQTHLRTVYVHNRIDWDGAVADRRHSV